MSKWGWPALGLFVAACFWGFWSCGPFDLDEGLYSVALMEMQQRGDWVVPTYRGAPFFEKPILFYWAAWIADLCGADGVAALRLPSILATLGTLALVGLFTKRIGPVMILSVSVPFMGIGRMFMPDPFLVFGMTAALFAFWKAREDHRWQVAAGVGLAIAVLAKGPMPLVVFGLLGIYCRVRIPSFVTSPPMVSGWKVAGILLFLAMVLPWYVIAAMKSPEFVDEFLIKQNFGRFTGAGDSAHLGQFWLYIPVVLLGLLPFSLSLVGAWRNRAGELEQFLWAFVWIVFLLFSFAGTKLPHYILPIFPPLAVLLARYLERDERTRWEFLAAALVLPAMLLYVMQGGVLEHRTMGGILLVTAVLHGLVVLAGPTDTYSKSLSIGFTAMAGMVITLLLLGPSIYWIRTHADPIEAAREANQTGLPIIEYRTGGEGESGKTAHPSMQWRIGKNTTPVETLPELRRIVESGSVAVITRDGRLERDQMRVSAPVGSVRRIESVGEFEVFIVSPGN